MKKKKLLAAVISFFSVVSAVAFVRKAKNAYDVNLINVCDFTLDCAIEGMGHDEKLTITALKPGERRLIKLTDLPLGPHGPVYIRFTLPDGQSFRRTLIYDVNENKGPVEALIVDYGQGYIDVKLVSQ